MSGSVADVRTGLPTEVAELMAPPARPWWGWLVSDRAARYTARLAFLLVWQWAGTVFEDIPTPLSTVEFLIEEFRDGEVWPNVAVSVARAVIGLSFVLDAILSRGDDTG